MLYFPPHLINASAQPCETENMEIVSFYVNVLCWFANIKHLREKIQFPCFPCYENPTMLSKVTAKNVGDVFLRHTVYREFS